MLSLRDTLKFTDTNRLKVKSIEKAISNSNQTVIKTVMQTVIKTVIKQ